MPASAVSPFEEPRPRRRRWSGSGSPAFGRRPPVFWPEMLLARQSRPSARSLAASTSVFPVYRQAPSKSLHPSVREYYAAPAPFHIACKDHSNDVRIVESLLGKVQMMKRGLLLCVLSALTVAAQESSDRYYQAVRNNDVPALRTLLKTAGVNAKDQRGTTPLMYAAAYGSLEAMKVLISAGADVNAKNAFDATALLWSAGDLAKVRFLVSKGADVNARSKQGRTPLIVGASFDGGFDVVKFLIEKGADISAKDGVGTTALVA